MITKNVKMITNTIFFMVLVVSLFSCDSESDSLYDTFTEFTPDKIVSVSAGEPTALLADEKVVMLIEISADPKVKRGFVTTDTGELKESFEINRTVFQKELVQVEFDATEGVENLVVYLEDAEGIRSVRREVTANVLGEEYRSSLSNREIETTTLDQTEFIINWNSNSERIVQLGQFVDVILEPLLLESTLTYTDVNDVEQTIVFDSTENETIITDFKPESTYSYTSSYKAFDTDDFPIIDSFQLNYTPDVFVTDAIEGSFPSVDSVD